METIGGGTVLDPRPLRHKRHDPAVLDALAIREQGSAAQRLMQAADSCGTALPTAAQLAESSGLDTDTLARTLAELLSSGQLAEPLLGRYVSASALDALWPRCRDALANYHNKHPLHAGMPAAELRQKLFRGTEPAEGDALLGIFLQEGRVRYTAGRYALTEFSVRLTRRQAALREDLLDRFRQGGMEPEPMETVLSGLPLRDQPEARQVLESLLTGGDLVRLSPELCWHKDIWQTALEALQALCAAEGTVTLAALRDALGTTRKYALLFLEACDRRRITVREGDLRRLNPEFLIK